MEARAFRDALGRFPTGVAIVTAAPCDEHDALIVNSLVSVSLEPPLIAFMPSRMSLTWSRMRRAQRFGVSVLAAEHEQFARQASAVGADRFAGMEWERTAAGVPLLSGALASLQARRMAEHPAGDHWIVVGQVEELRIAQPAEPLIFFAGELAQAGLLAVKQN